MASTHKHIRSSTANKRPTTAIADGQIALNTNSASPGLFFKDSTGATIIKIGPVHVGATAPNASPAAGGSAGNSTGEIWLDNSLTPVGVKIWNGSAWVNATPIGSTTVQGLLELATDAETQAGSDNARAVTPASLQSKVSDSTSTTSSTTIASSTAVKAAYDLANAALPKAGGTITGALEIGTTGSLSFEGSTADGFETTIAVVDPTADRTITLPNTTGTVVTTGDTGTVTSTMLADGTIVDADINSAAAIAHSKLASLTSANILLGNASNVATSTAVTGDVTISNTGVTAIASGAIVDADISASAEIAVSKLADGAARQLLQTDAAGTGVEWASNIDIPGTLDVTGAAAFDSSVAVTGALTKSGSNVVTVGDTGTVTSTMIANDTIVNADINSAAAIAGTKISPDFGSQTITTSGLFSHALGTAGAPTITFTGDTNTGIYSPGADQVAISTNGSGRLFVNSSGSVGVGNNNPSRKLDVFVSDNTTYVGNADDANSLNLFNTSTTNETFSSIRLGSQGSGGAGLVTLYGVQTANAAGSGYFAISTRNAGTFGERFRITSGGLVGIGTSAPGALLHVSGGRTYLGSSDGYELAFARTGNYFYWYNDGGNLSGKLSLTASAGAGGGEIITFTQDTKRVGIGTTSPDAALDVFGVPNANYGNATLFDSTSTAANVGGVLTLGGYKTAQTSRALFGFIKGGKENATSGNESGYLAFGTNNNSSNSEKVRIDSSGRLLVGTSSSTGSNNDQVQSHNTTGNNLGLGRFSNTGGGPDINFYKSRSGSVGTSTVVQQDDTLGVIAFNGSDGSSYRIAAQIAGVVDGAVTGGGVGDMPGRLVFSTTADGASSPTERMRITNDGNTMISSTAYTSARLGIGGYTNGDRFGVYMRPSADNATAFSFNNASGTSVGSITTTASATAFNTSSDYRLKENVTAVTDGITRLLQLKPSRFNFIADSGKTVDGFIAHEVQAVVPEAITGEKDAVDHEGNPIYQGIDQSKLVPLLTAALQEAIGEIEKLKARVVALESKP